MIRIIFYFLFLCYSLNAQESPRPDFSQLAKPRTIKVLLKKGLSSSLLEVRGKYQIINMSNDLEIELGVSTKRFAAIPTAQGIDWGAVYPAIFQMRIAPLDADSYILVDGIQYRGCIELCQVKGKLHIINEVDIESFLKSTLTAEFAQRMSEEILQAIAIIARTNAYYVVSKNPSAFWHIDAKESSYLGYGATLQNLYVDMAVNRTKNVILIYNHKPFAATWTKNCAGKTAPYSLIFRKNSPSPSGITSAFAAQMREKNSWSVSVPLEKISETPSNISRIETFREKLSGKVYALRLKSDHKNIDIPILKLFSFGLKSNDFFVSLKNGELVFKGFGEGFGTGLCLYTSETLVRQGVKTKELLKTFFPNTCLHLDELK